MSVQALSWVFDHSPTTGSDRLVLLAIANHADVDGAHSFPGIDTLAREARVSRATAKRSIRALEDDQHIDVVHGIGRGHPNLYRVITDPARVGTPRTGAGGPAGTPVSAVPDQRVQPEPVSRDGKPAPGPRDKRAQLEPVRNWAQVEPVPRPEEGVQPEPVPGGKRAHLRAEKGSSTTKKGLTGDPLTVNNRHTTENLRTRAPDSNLNDDGKGAPSESGSHLGDALFALDALPRRLDDEVRQVFGEWVRVTGRTDRTRLDEKRRSLIERQLRHYPVEDLLDAVRGWRHSPWHSGQNKTGEPVHELGQLIGDAASLERFRGLERSARQRGSARGTNPSDASIGRFPAAGEVNL